MSNVLDYYEYAKLATAAYVVLDGQPLDGATVSDQANAQERLPLKLAEQTFDLASNPNAWTIPPGGYHGNDAEGFAATLFQRTSASGATEKVLAIRGTEPSISPFGDLLKADLGEIGFLGLAMGQTVSMMNYILQMQADKTNYQVKQYVLEFSATQPANGLGIPLQASPTDPIKGYLYLAETVTTVNGLGLIAPGEKITVTGHSLGGHLAAMAARLFPDLVSDAYTYNAPGFDPITAELAALLAGRWKKSIGFALKAVGNVALQLTDEFVSLAGNYLSSAPASGFNTAVIHTLESEDIDGFPDVNIVPSIITGAQAFGAETMVTTERNSHMIEPFMDSLALQALIYRMNDTLVTSGNVKRLFENVSNTIPDTMETLVEELYKLFQGSSVDLINVDVKYDNASGLIGIGTGNIDGRRDFYDKLIVLENMVKANPALHLEMVNGANIFGQAQASTADAIAYRYALVNGNPFAVVGNDTLYDLHNANGELDLYDPATNTGSLTSEYLTDRAAWLSWKMKYDSGQHDDNDVVTTVGDKSYTDQWDSDATPGNWDYIDHSLKPDGNPLLLAIDGSGRSLYDHQIVFGSQAADTVEGSGDTDHLYGMSGDDTLQGNGSNDYLEGGQGTDTYVWNSGDGMDSILDTDGLGSIVIDGQMLGAGESKNGGHSYTHTDANGNKHIYTVLFGDINSVDGATLIIDNAVQIHNYHAGDLGLTMGTASSPQAEYTAAGDPTIHYGVFMAINEQHPDWVMTRLEYVYAEEIQPDGRIFKTLTGFNVDYFVVDANFNPVESGAQARDDTLRGTQANDHLMGLAGNDILSGGSNAGNDRYEGGSGDDLLEEGIGNDVLDGGSGQDKLKAGEDNDVLIGGAESDIMEGGLGDDCLFGNVEITAEQAIADGNLSAGSGQATGSGQRGDWLAGGIGDDILITGADNDVLSGGAGRDLLIAGAGDDDIIGDVPMVATRFDWTITDQVVSDTQTNRIFQSFTMDYILGEQGATDVIHAGTGNDHAWGGEGDDIIYGEDGNDILAGNDGNDEVNGGADDDVLHGDGAGATWQTIVDGNDRLDGGLGNDTLWGDGGNDTLLGGDNNDQLYGDSDSLDAQWHGNDYLDGEAGDDTLVGNGGDDILYGGADNDTLWAGENNDLLDGEDGNDTLWGGNGGDVLMGGLGNDKLYGEAGANYLDGGDGADTLNSGGPGSELVGGAGNDDISAAGGGNTLDGGEGNDTLVADSGDNYLDGGNGVNKVQATGGGNALFAGTGNDDLAAWGDGNYLDAGNGNNTLYVNGKNSELYAGSGNDNLQATGGNNSLDGGAGNNTLVADSGGNTLIAGAGDDTLSSTGGGSYLDGGDGTNTLIADGGYNELYAGSGNDTLSAAGGNNYLDGGDGTDYLIADGGSNELYGGAGDDTLVARGGNNTMDGGDGMDIYVFDAGAGTNHIADSGIASSGSGQEVGNEVRFNFSFADSGLAVGLGSLKLSFANGDELHIDNYDPNDPTGSCSISTFVFDHTTLRIQAANDPILLAA